MREGCRYPSESRRAPTNRPGLRSWRGGPGRRAPPWCWTSLGSNFGKLVQIYAADYGLEVGEKKWDIKSEGDAVKARLEIPLLKGGETKGRAVMEATIPKTPTGEEGNNYVYTADVQYYIEIDEQVLAESTTSGMVEFSL
jgi:hypothetical protein